MDAHPYLSAAEVPRSELRTRLAREIVAVIDAEEGSLISLIRVKRLERDGTAGDLIEFNLEPAVPTRPVHPIAVREPMLFFLPDDPQQAPEVFALREDFPNVPHLNMLRWSYPRSLCLFNRPYIEYRKRLSGYALIQRTLQWLALTARGELHAEDQPLEPLIMRAGHDLILPTLDPHALLSQPLSGYPKSLSGNLLTIMPTRSDEKATLTCTVLPIETPPMIHGVIRQAPQTLGQLHALLKAETGFDLNAALISVLTPLRGNEYQNIWDNNIVLVLALPKVRKAGATPEGVEYLAYFLEETTIKSIGRALDLWYEQETGLGVVLRPNPEHRTDHHILLQSMQVRFPLNRRSRALYNGSVPNQKKIVAVGAGALGSQVISNLVRAGQGQWTIVDDDDLMPHNLARHAVFGQPYGVNKALLMAAYAKGTFEDAEVKGLYGNVLNPDDQVSRELHAAQVICDFSASAAVSYHLSTQPYSGRRICAFLNPTGTDLVVLAESSDRKVRLDDLEYQFYQSLVDEAELAGHFAGVPPYQRYGGGCRDVSLVLSQDLLALHAATSSRMIKEILRGTDAFAALFKTNERGELQRFNLPTRSFSHLAINGWQVSVDPGVLLRARRLRMEALQQSPPVETGGTLVGAVNLEDRRIAITGLLPAPPDSRHYPVAFERGSAELRELYERIEQRTGGALSYLGEWHSHPMGSTAQPSSDDQKLFQWLKNLLQGEGIPPVMLIVAEAEERWFIDRIEEKQHGSE